MNAAFLCNALDSSAALFNIFDHLHKSFTTIKSDVLKRDVAHVQLNHPRSPYNVLIYDSAYGAAMVNSRLNDPSRFKHVIFHHIHESPQQEARKHAYIDSVDPALVLCTFDGMTAQVEKWGYKAKTVPFSFDTTRFSHLSYPTEFTIGYMGADMTHKGFDVVDAVAAKLSIPCVGARRPSHEDGPFARREQAFYRQISCYVAAPTHESGPLPPIEAQLCGRPCVVTPVGMMPYIFANGAGGSLTRPEDLETILTLVRDTFEIQAAKACAFVLPNTAPLYEAAILEACA